MSPGGRIRDSDIEAVRERTDIVQVISEYVPLKKAGREYRGPCPFHKEKDPSFYVNPAKEVFFCHGCKAGGNVVSFLMQIDGLGFAEAIEKLADRIGYRLTYDAASPDELKGRLEKDRLFKLNQTAADFFHYNLVETPAGGPAREYLAGRGFSSGIAGEYRIGFAPPGWENLSGFLSRKGFEEREMATVGLARERPAGRSRDGRGVYDLFRDRIMFPILDHRGRVVAFSARRMPGEEEGPKYINSPESPVYRKGKVLYGFYQARQAIQDAREAVVVEGCTDLLALRQAGVMPVVAPLGTALTESHLELLSRFSDRIFLAFDADRAGMEAAKRVLEFFNSFSLEILVITLPPGEDPASVIEKGGAGAFLDLKERAVSILDFSVERIIASMDTSSAVARQKALQACAPVLSRVASPEMRPARDELLRKVASRLEMPEETVQVFARNALRPPGARARDGAGQARLGLMSDKVESEALRVLAHSLEALREHRYLDDGFFAEPVNKKILAILKEFPVGDEEVSQTEYDAFLRQRADTAEDEGVRRRLLELLVESPPDCGQGEEGRVFDRLMLMFLKRRKQKVEADIRNTNKRLEPKKYDALCGQLLELQQLIRDQLPYDHG